MSTRRKPEEFKPCIWEAQIDGKRFTILVCADSYRDTGGTLTEFGGKVVDELCHPVAIRFGAPAHILYGFKDTSHEWLVRTVEEVGMSRLSAQRALSEAWRGVENISWPEFPRKIMNFRFRVNKITSLADCAKQEKTMFRNVNSWVRWDSWEKQGLTSAQKGMALSAIGIPTSKKAFDKMVENIGL
jgi:hypothetical protein